MELERGVVGATLTVALGQGQALPLQNRPNYPVFILNVISSGKSPDSLRSLPCGGIESRFTPFKLELERGVVGATLAVALGQGQALPLQNRPNYPVFILNVISSVKSPDSLRSLPCGGMESRFTAFIALRRDGIPIHCVHTGPVARVNPPGRTQ
jgi:hypothetical protein